MTGVRPGDRLTVLLCEAVAVSAWSPRCTPRIPYVTVRFGPPGAERVADVPLDGSALILPGDVTAESLYELVTDAVVEASAEGDEEKERRYLALLSALEEQAAGRGES